MDENFNRFYLKHPRNRFYERRFRSEIFYETSPSPIFGAKCTTWRISRKNRHGRKLCSLLQKTPLKSFFRMAHFKAVFFYESAISPIFRAKWNMWCVSRQNILTQKLQSFLPKTLSKSFFRKIRFRSELFYETTSPIFGAKRTMWRISRKNRHGRKFHSLLHKTPRAKFPFRTIFPRNA